MKKKILKQVEYESARRMKICCVDSIFRTQTVLEWVFQQVILRSSCSYLVRKHVNDVNLKWRKMTKNRQKTQQKVTKNSQILQKTQKVTQKTHKKLKKHKKLSKGYKKLNKWIQKTQQMDTKNSTKEQKKTK